MRANPSHSYPNFEGQKRERKHPWRPPCTEKQTQGRHIETDSTVPSCCGVFGHGGGSHAGGLVRRTGAGCVFQCTLLHGSFQIQQGVSMHMLLLRLVLLMVLYAYYCGSDLSARCALRPCLCWGDDRPASLLQA